MNRRLFVGAAPVGCDFKWETTPSATVGCDFISDPIIKNKHNRGQKPLSHVKELLPAAIIAAGLPLLP